MISVQRAQQNPLLTPNPANEWEASAVFNGCPIKGDSIYHLLYRAVSAEKEYKGSRMRLSTIGYAKSTDGVHFEARRQLIVPEYDWEKYGCEDPRVTQIDDTYYIFYTALSDYPHTPLGIKLAVAITKDFKTIIEKHLVTPFNAKAMALFPEKINDKFVAVLTPNTDFPPARIAIAEFDHISDMWSFEYWQEWHRKIDDHRIPLKRLNHDQIEAGAPPLKTEKGWLFFYSHIQNYGSDNVIFGNEAALLHLADPHKIVGRTTEPLMSPQEPYEIMGDVPNIVFPSGALIENDTVHLYYGGADTVVARASMNLEELLTAMTSDEAKPFVAFKLTKFEHNPILFPDPNHYWESLAVFNAGAFYADDKMHIIYRAMSRDNTSSMGYAVSRDGVHIDERLIEPIYLPRESFEDKKKTNANSGCEDPRITKIGDMLYMCYTAYDSINPPRVALTSISYHDFKERRFIWKRPVLISPEGVDDKDACILPEKVNDKYVVLHRINNEIVIDYVSSLDFDGHTFLHGTPMVGPRKGFWDDLKIGIAGPPVKTDDGWLLLYHGVNRADHEYRVGAMILDLNDPAVVLYRSEYPILQPTTQFERYGIVPNVVFPCGMAVIDNKLYVPYGGADTNVCVAYGDLPTILSYIKDSPVKKQTALS